MFVAAGGHGRMLTSADGITWSDETEDGDTLEAVTYGNGRFVAVRVNGRIMTSTDGATWLDKTENIDSLNAVTYDNGMFIAVGDYGLIMTLPDGENRTSYIAAANAFYTVATAPLLEK